MLNLRGPLAQLGFTHIFIDVAGRYSIADIFPNKSNRCGIYVLHFEDGEFYVGQSIDVVKRHAQHRKTYTDIVRLSFMPSGRKELNAAEVRVVKAMEGLGHHLRNIQIVDFSYARTDLEELVAREDLEWWLEDADHILDCDDWLRDDAAQRRRYQRRFSEFLERPEAVRSLMLGNTYVRSTIPVPYATERAFWACTMQDQQGQLYYRVNVGGQTTFQVQQGERDDVCYGIFLPRPSVQAILGDLSGVKGDYALVMTFPENGMKFEVISATLKEGHHDQVALVTSDADVIIELLNDPGIVLACRRFQVGLMQKGPCRWAQNHVFDLADLLLAPLEDEAEEPEPLEPSG